MKKTKMKNSEVKNDLSETIPKWFAVYTGYKREKVVRTLLESQDIEVFLPLQKVHRQWDRKKRTVELPLINCYVFVKIVKQEYVPVLSTQNVVSFLKVGRDLEAIPDQQIEILKRVIGEDIPIETCSESMKAGDAVEIIAGNLIGIKGRMVEIKGKNKFVVKLDRVGFNLLLELPSNLISRISEKELLYL